MQPIFIKAHQASENSMPPRLLMFFTCPFRETRNIERTDSLTKAFAAIKTGISATPPMNTFSDTTATNAGPYIYRLRLEE